MINRTSIVAQRQLVPSGSQPGPQEQPWWWDKVGALSIQQLREETVLVFSSPPLSLFLHIYILCPFLALLSQPQNTPKKPTSH